MLSGNRIRFLIVPFALAGAVLAGRVCADDAGGAPTILIPDRANSTAMIDAEGWVEPIEVREALALEAEAVNPNPGAFRDFAAATVVLNPGAVRSVLEGQAAYAPPAAPPAAAAPPDPPAAGAAGEPVFEAVDIGRSGRAPSEPANTCVHCDAKLPRTRQAVFCPFCGHELQALHCTRCGDPLEPGWRFCLTCGHPAQG